MSLLDKIREEAKTPSVSVEQRQDNLIENIANENQTRINQSAKGTEDLDTSLAAELASFPPIAKKKVGVRLEEEVLDALEVSCKEYKITIETFLEAAFLVCSQDTSVMNQTIDEAQTRLARRKRAGTIRSILTKSQNLYRKPL